MESDEKIADYLSRRHAMMESIHYGDLNKGRIRIKRFDGSNVSTLPHYEQEFCFSERHLAHRILCYARYREIARIRILMIIITQFFAEF